MIQFRAVNVSHIGSVDHKVKLIYNVISFSRDKNSNIIPKSTDDNPQNVKSTPKGNPIAYQGYHEFRLNSICRLSRWECPVLEWLSAPWDELCSIACKNCMQFYQSQSNVYIRILFVVWLNVSQNIGIGIELNAGEAVARGYTKYCRSRDRANEPAARAYFIQTFISLTKSAFRSCRKQNRNVTQDSLICI